MPGGSHAPRPTFVEIPDDFDMMDSVISDFNDGFRESRKINCVEQEEDEPATLQDLQAALRQMFLQIYCQECSPNTGVVSANSTQSPPAELPRRPRNTQGQSPRQVNFMAKDFIDECPPLPFGSQIGDSSNKSSNEVHSMYSCPSKSSDELDLMYTC